MVDQQNVLYTTPSGEHITARRSTRVKFLQQESSQLKAYILDLESSLGTNKLLLRELVASVKTEIPLDKLLVSRIVRNLQAANEGLTDRIRRVTVEKNDALLKAQASDRLMSEVISKDGSEGHPLEAALRAKREILAGKEKEVQDLDTKCKVLSEEIEEHNKFKEITGLGQGEADTLMTEKYVRLKEINEKLQKELMKSQATKADLEATCRELFSDLQKLNSSLKTPISRAGAVEHLLDDSSRFEGLDEIKLSEETEGPETVVPNTFLMKQLQLIKARQHSKSVSNRISLPLSSFTSQNEQRCLTFRLELEATKASDKIRDLHVKLETLQDELQMCKRLNAQMGQDQYRLASALDTLKRRKKALETAGKRPSTTKAASTAIKVNKTVQSPKHRKRGKASSNPLEYVDNLEISGVPLTARCSKPPLVFSDEQEDEEVEEEEEQLNPEMPSMINRADADEFLQGDSFLVDAFNLKNRS